MKRSLLVLLLFGLPVIAPAQEFNYNFAQLSYGTVDFDDIDLDGEVLALDFSLEITDEFYLVAEYAAGDLDFGVDTTEWSAGVGYNTSLSPVIDVFAQLTYEYAEVEVGPGDADDSGFGIGIGLRGRPAEQMEIYGGVEHVDFGDSGDNTALFAGFLYSFTDQIAAGVNGSWDDDVSYFGITGRLYFDL